MILSFINIRKIPREVLKTSGFVLDLQHLNRDWEARWPSGRASDTGAIGQGSILTQVAVLYT